MEHINIKKHQHRHQHQHQRRSSTSKICNHWKTEGGCTYCTSLRRYNRTKPTGFSVQNIVKLRIELGVVLFFCAVLPPLPQNSVDEIKSVRRKTSIRMNKPSICSQTRDRNLGRSCSGQYGPWFQAILKIKKCCVLCCLLRRLKMSRLPLLTCVTSCGDQSTPMHYHYHTMQGPEHPFILIFNIYIIYIYN